MKTNFIFLILMSIVFACKKKRAVDFESQLVGNWRHNSDNIHTIYLEIDSDSKGYIEYYENGEFKSDTQHRKWLVKNNTLYFGWMSGRDEKFSIDSEPQIATFEFIKEYDTIIIGNRFVIFDGKYFVE